MIPRLATTLRGCLTICRISPAASSVANERPVMPRTDADRTIAGTSSQIAPSGFQGKPMILVDLAHSPSAKSELVAKSCEPGFLFANSRARTMGTDQKSDRIADMAERASHPAVRSEAD